jgi:hypothetical protein
MTHTKTVVLDVDQPIFDFRQEFWNFAATQVPNLGELTTSEWDFYKPRLSVEQFLELFALGVNEYRLYRQMQPVAGAVEGVARFRRAGWNIRYVTARSVGNPQIIEQDTKWSLSACGLLLPGEEPVFATDKLAACADADAAFDDSPANVAALRAGGLRTVVYSQPDQPYNHEVEGERAASVLEFAGLVLGD